MDDHNNQPIIIKRIKKIKKAGHHGGAWKIAYADFVTAMMAFFLIMWLLALLNKSQLESISEYFKKPTKKGLVDKGTALNQDKVKNLFIEKGNERSEWKDKDKDKDKDKNKDQDKSKEINKEKEKKKDDNKNKELKKEDKKEDNKEKEKEKEKEKAKPVPPAIQAMRDLKKSLEKQLETNPQLEQFKNSLNFVVTADGLKIILKDLQNKPMFTTGKADFQKYAGPLLDWLSKELNTYPNQIQIIGHTDTVKFNTENYSNWELSADRANATRRSLVKSGMKPEKIVRVIGSGDKDLLDKSRGEDPANRRIEIMVLTDEARQRIEESDQ